MRRYSRGGPGLEMASPGSYYSFNTTGGGSAMPTKPEKPSLLGPDGKPIEPAQVPFGFTNEN